MRSKKTCEEIAHVRTLAKNAIVELSRNPEQLNMQYIQKWNGLKLYNNEKILEKW